jgi:hypothetical protein
MADGSESPPLLVGVSVTGPMSVGVMEKVCGADELLKVNTTGVLKPPPDGMIVIVPL